MLAFSRKATVEEATVEVAEEVTAEAVEVETAEAVAAVVEIKEEVRIFKKNAVPLHSFFRS